MNDTSIIQAIFDRVYEDEFLMEKLGESYRSLLNSLNDFARRIIAFGNFNYQTENGGLVQWVDNGYCCKESVRYIKELLQEINTPEALETIKTIDIVAEHVDLSKEGVGLADYYWSREPDDEDYDRFDTLASAYYKENDKLMESVENYCIAYLASKEAILETISTTSIRKHDD